VRRSVASAFLTSAAAKVAVRPCVKKSIRSLDHGVGIPLPPSNRAGEGYQFMPTRQEELSLLTQIIEHRHAVALGENVS
jgi:hypothetical protein